MQPTVVVFAVICGCILSTAVALQCYECNVWKAGYGHLCENPRIRDDCTVCMKTETVVYMGYYKNTPRKTVVESKICAKSNTVHFSNECHRYDTSDGTSTRCYCQTDRCNSASTFSPHSSLLMLTGLGLFSWIYHNL